MADIAFSAVKTAIVLCHGLAERCRTLTANREMLQQLAQRFELLGRSLDLQRERNSSPSLAWRSAVQTMTDYLTAKVAPFLEAMAGAPPPSGVSRMRALARANENAEKIRVIAKRLDELSLDLSFQVNVNGFADVNDKVDDVQLAIDAVQDNMGTVLRRMLIIQELIVANAAATVSSADDFAKRVDAVAQSPEIAQKESAVVASYHVKASGQRRAVAVSAPVGASSANLGAHLHSPAPVTPAFEAGPAPQRKAAQAPVPSAVGPASPGSTMTVESLITRSTGGSTGRNSDDAGASVDEEYLMIMSMRERLGPQVAGLLSSLSKNSALPSNERSEVREVVRALWEPWRIARDKIEYVVKNGAKKLLGTGGYGRVYMGSVTALDGTRQKVAVKELEGIFSDIKFKADFEREVALLRDLCHPCIVSFVGASWPEAKQVDPKAAADEGATAAVAAVDLENDSDDDDSDPTDATAIIVTERMSCNLSSALRGGLLEDDAAKASAMLDVAEGMVYLHSKRVVHMDIKPENILCRVKAGKDGAKDLDGRAKISDFGVSQTKRDTSSRTMTRVAGTKLYMAPELMRKGRKLRLSSDVWSFGVMVCTLFADIQDVEKLNDDDLSAEANAGTLDRLFESSIRKIRHSGVRQLAAACLVDDAAQRPAFTGIRNILRAIVNGDPIERVSYCVDYSRRDWLFMAAVKSVAENRERGAAMMNRAVGLVPATLPATGLVSFNSEIAEGLRVMPEFAVQAIEWNEAAVHCKLPLRVMRALRALLLGPFLRSDKCADMHELPGVNRYLARYSPETNASTAFFAGMVMFRSSKRTHSVEHVQAAGRLFQLAYSLGDSWGGVFYSAMLTEGAGAQGEVAANAKVEAILSSAADWNCALALCAQGSLFAQSKNANATTLGSAKVLFGRAMELGETYQAPHLLARLMIQNRGRLGSKVANEDRVLSLCNQSIEAGNVEGAKLAAEFYVSRGRLAAAETFANRACTMKDRDGSAARLAAEIRARKLDLERAAAGAASVP